jgi:hypothetical protein
VEKKQMTMTWFKLHHEIIDDIKIRRFSAQEKWAWIVLLSLASKSSDRGKITADNEDLADYCEFNSTQDWLYYRDKLITKGMLEINATGGLTVIHWDDRQAKKPSDDPTRIKERVAKSRAKRKSEATSQSQEGVSRYKALQGESNADVSPQKRERSDQSRSDQNVDSEKEISFAQENNFENLQDDLQDSENSLSEKKIESLALENKSESEDLKTTPLPPSKNSIQSFEDRMRSGAKSWIWQRKISDRPEWGELLTDWAKTKDCKLGFKNSLIEAQKAFLKKRNLTSDHAAAMNSLSNYIKADDIASFMIRTDEAIAIEQAQTQRSQQQSAPIAVQELTATAPPAHIRERFKTA